MHRGCLRKCGVASQLLINMFVVTKFAVLGSALLLETSAGKSTEQLVSVRPLVYVIPEFATLKETASILERIESCHKKEWPECQEQKSNLHAKGKSRFDGESSRPLRNSTSFTLTLKGEIHEAFDDIVRRAHAIARHPITFGEGVQIASYYPGDYYGFHHDSLTRRATLLLYLTDIADGDGGETIFPMVRAPGVPDDATPPLPPAVTGRRRPGLDFKVEKMEEMTPYCDSDFYLKVRPEAGKAILFYSYGPNYAFDEFAIHGACPLKRGHKAILQRWMRFEENSLFGKSEDLIRSVRSELGQNRLLQPVERNVTENETNPYAQFGNRRSHRRRSLNDSEVQSDTEPSTPAEL